jgi:methylphosphotriester-DNA--protein-cysteine methyltransferase
MIRHGDLSDKALKIMLQQKLVNFGGHRSLRIYGHLDCSSGKRMKRLNRVFFKSEQEAKEHGFRPCGHCMKAAYQKWKNGII